MLLFDSPSTHRVLRRYARPTCPRNSSSEFRFSTTRGDKAYDSDPLDQELKERGIEMIAPHKRNRKKPKTQDGRSLRRYKRRSKVERFFAWLQNASPRGDSF
jgi:hypothetical protein